MNSDELQAAGLAMLAAGIAGRRVSIARLDGAAGPTFSDGQTIFVSAPAWRDDGPLEVLLQAAIIRSGTLDAAMMRLLAGRASVARRYLHLESQRAVQTLRDQLPRPVLEHLAFDSRLNLSNSPQQSLEIALSTRPLPQTADCCGTIRPLRILFAARANPDFAATVSARSGKTTEAQVDELDETQDSEESKILKLFSNPLASGTGALSQLLRKLLGMGRKPAAGNSGSGGGAELPIGSSQRAMTRAANAVLSLLPQDLMFRDSLPSARACVYPEWDEFTKRYKSAWTFVEEFVPFPLEDAPAARANFASPPLEMFRGLARLGCSHEQHSRQRQGEHLDIDALVRMVLDVRARAHADERIYHGSLRTRRDLGVLLLVDVSGSSGEGSSPARRVHDEQITLCYQLAQVLQRLGDQVAVYGFQSWGRTAVRFLQVKHFQERLDGAALQRLESLEPGGYTRTGAAVRHAARLLRDHSGTPYKLLVVISDGFAYDDGYEGAYGEHDTRRALQEARDSGVGCACISVAGEVESQRLARVFGTAGCLRIARAQDAASHVGPLFGFAIKRTKQRKLLVS